MGGSARPENEAALRQFLAKPTVQVLVPSRETAEHYARLFVQLRTAGTPVPINDLWIASLVLQHDLILVTRDEHFRKIPQVIQAQF
jgi:tRNA(fMet)-specific endonuclease VapC